MPTKDFNGLLRNDVLERKARGQRHNTFHVCKDLLAWGRKNSIWPFNFGLSCCYVENGDQLDKQVRYRALRRRGHTGKPSRGGPLIIAGTVFIKIAPVIRRLYEQMMQPDG